MCPVNFQGKILPVSRGVTCFDSREPLGVVASIVPFNFPIMVPMWTIPIALTAGNCVILKPSEKVGRSERRNHNYPYLSMVCTLKLLLKMHGNFLSVHVPSFG